jgi:mono/diheme cytochrome c family protein
VSTTPPSSSGPPRYWGLLIIVALVTVASTIGVVAAIGGQNPDVDLANGKTKFVAVCGGCHAMEDAGTEGLLGPNMDDAFRQARQSGFNDTQFRGVVNNWIANAPQPPRPSAQPPMPQNLVTGQDAEDVSAYVASVAGRSEESVVVPIQPGNVGPPPGAPPADGDGPPTDTTDPDAESP